METNFKFGKVTTTKVLDENGSIETVTENKVKGEVVRPLRRYYEIKERVRNDQEEYESYMKFSQATEKDRTMLDPAFKREHRKTGDEKGYYYVSWCFTRLEY